MSFKALALTDVVTLILATAKEGISAAPGEKPPASWVDLKEPPRFPSLIEEHGAVLTAWVLPGTAVGNRACPNLMEHDVRVRWLICHPGFDRTGIDTAERQKAALRTLTVAQAMESALLGLTCGDKPAGVVWWAVGRSEAVRPEAKSAGWEVTVTVRM